MRTAIVLALVLVPRLAAAQAPTPSPCQREYARLAKAIADAKSKNDRAAVDVAIDDLVKVGRNAACFTEFAGRRDAVKSVIRAFEQTRTDKQEGTAGGATGTASVVSRGVAAKVLSVAVENGALTQSVKKSVVTLTGNLAGVPSALARKDIIPFCDPRFGTKDGNCVTSDTLRALKRISFGVSFDTSRDAVTATPPAGSSAGSGQSSVPVEFAASTNELSQVTARYEIVNHRDVSSKEYQAKWLVKVKTQPDLKGAADDLNTEMVDSLDPLLKTKVYVAWEKRATQKLRAADAADVEGLWYEQLSDLVLQLRASSDDFDERLTRLRGAFQAFDLAEDLFVDELATKPVLSFEYVNDRPVAQTSISTYRVVGDFGWKHTNNLTFNVAVGLFDREQVAIDGRPSGRVRDYELGIQYERALGQLSVIGPAAVDVAAYYQDQRLPAVLDVNPKQPLPGITLVGLPDGAKKIFGEKGRIGVVQFRFVLGPGKSSARVPFAVSWASRTDLVDQPVWRAQVGLTYDFDSLLAR
jgi:hypothetical protein